MKTLALIPARSGSKGIPGKNIRDFHGKPLMVWAIEVGLATCDKTYVSTDSPWITKRAVEAGAGFLVRPKRLVRDETPMLPVVQHALGELLPWKPDVVVLLQPTQPFRTAEHVTVALEELKQTGADSVVSVVEIPAHYTPDYAMKMTKDGNLVPFMGYSASRRQDAREAYFRDGTVYAIRREVVESGSLYGDKCLPLFIPHSQSVNLDTEDDWQRAVAMKGRHHGQRKAG